MAEPEVGGMVCRLCALVAERFGDRVNRFATFNEPSIFNLFSRSLGKRDGSAEANLHRATHHVNLAHGVAVDVLRENVPGASSGAFTIVNRAGLPVRTKPTRRLPCA